MLKSARAKSTARMPLSDISNAGKPSRTANKKQPSPPPPPPPPSSADDGDDLDRLLLARSDLVNQIDELVTYAVQLKTLSKTGSQEIESFSHVLSDMHSTLKPWVSRLQQAFSGTFIVSEKQSVPSVETTSVAGANEERNVVPSNPDEPDSDLISPSPLVSWRNGSCTVQSGKQLFLLTPLPKSKILSSRFRNSAKSMVGKFKDTPHNTLGVPEFSITRNLCSDNLMQRVDAKMAPSDASKPCVIEANSASEVQNQKSRKNSTRLPTPCLKVLPPTSCILANQHQSFQNDDGGIPKPAQVSDDDDDDDDDEEVTAGLTLRQQQFLGLQPGPNFTSRKQEFDETLDWFLSPPKTCILMEPSDEELLRKPATSTLLTTPLVRHYESTARRGKRPGESTLKRELWVKFDAASASGLCFDTSVFQKTSRKGFMDMLEEACETEDSDSRVAR